MRPAAMCNNMGFLFLYGRTPQQLLPVLRTDSQSRLAVWILLRDEAFSDTVSDKNMCVAWVILLSV